MGRGVGEGPRHRETCTLPRVQTGEVIHPRAQATFLPALGPSPPGLEPQRQNDRRLIVQTKTPKKMKWSPTDDYARTTSICHSIQRPPLVHTADAEHRPRAEAASIPRGESQGAWLTALPRGRHRLDSPHPQPTRTSKDWEGPSEKAPND